MIRLSVLLALLVASACGALAASLSVESSMDMSVKPSFTEDEHTAFLQEFKQSHPQRFSPRHASGLNHELHEKAMLFFRSLDVDHDKLITQQDADASFDKIRNFVPGINPRDFASFIEAADRNHDGALNVNEFTNAFVVGLSTHPAAPSLLETSSMTNVARVAHRRAARVGLIGDAFNAAKNFVGGKVNELKNHVMGTLDTTQDACVMCQYILQRCEGNIRASGVIGSVTSAQMDAASMLETSSKATTKVHAESQQAPDMDAAAAADIGSTRENTRYMRLMERQKYNELYRIVDITLDDVCEQGTPNAFYGYCKQIYQTQSDIVDGFRYQYRPSDICFRIGMCEANSYIVSGIHSRYK